MASMKNVEDKYYVETQNDSAVIKKTGFSRRIKNEIYINLNYSVKFSQARSWEMNIYVNSSLFKLSLV